MKSRNLVLIVVVAFILILGGCGTTLEELTGLFSFFSNNCYYISTSYSYKDPSHKKVNLVSP